MGLRQTIADAVNTAFDAIGDLVEPVTYKSLTTAVYDTATGNVVYTSSDIALARTVFYEFEKKEIDADVAPLTDMKMIFPTADLGVTPKATDVFVDSLSRTWEVIRLMTVPGNSVTMLHVRTTR